MRNQAIVADTHVFGMCAVSEAEDTTSGGAGRPGRADLLDDPRELEAQDPPPGPSQAEHEAPEERARSAHVAIRLRHGARMDAHEDLVVRRNRALDVLDPQHLRWPV